MAAHESNDLPEGLTLLDRYTIVDRVGGGGMATIHRAHDTRLDRIVCVKLLRLVIEGSGSTSGGVVYQATYTHFLQEARALSKLAHPNTLRIYDFGYLDVEAGPGPRPFQISEFLDGGNLEHYVRTRGALKPAEVLAILDRVAGAVGEAHGLGILHRDIKPSNILFSRVGDVLMPKLADFGIARALRRKPRGGDTGEGSDSNADAVVPHVPLFSPRWAAPEQIAEREEGPQTDVYTLALLVAFMLSGRSLFDVADVTSTFTARVKGDEMVKDRLREMALAPEVARVMMNALRADPAARTHAPFELYEQLARALSSPRATLPATIAHSGGVPGIAARPSRESITLETGADGAGAHGAAAQSIVPPERCVDVAGRRVRVVETHERLDLAVASPGGGPDVRFRVTLVPARGAQFRVHVKGLSCFVAKPGGTPSPAIVSDADGSAQFVSMHKEPLSSLSWSFGTERGRSRVFAVDGADLVVPYPQGACAVALELGSEREIIVICRRA